MQSKCFEKGFLEELKELITKLEMGETGALVTVKDEDGDTLMY